MRVQLVRGHWFTLACCLVLSATAQSAAPTAFFEARCYDCHDAETKKGGLDLKALKTEFTQPEVFAHWVKVYDRIVSGEMPPKKEERPPVHDIQEVTGWLRGALCEAERTRLDAGGRTALRRLTRAEYENTVRDLFDLPGILLQEILPADGMAHGFDKNSEALDISHVNLAQYVEAADKALDLAIVRQPQPPPVQNLRVSLGASSSGVTAGAAVLLKDKQVDPDYPPAGEQQHLSMSAHVRAGSFDRGSTLGVFRNEYQGFKQVYGFAAPYQGRYRMSASFWSFQWDKGQVLPARGTEAARLSILHAGRSGSNLLGYCDAPSLNARVGQFEAWLNANDTIEFNAASLVPGGPGGANGKDRAMGFTRPGVATDWLNVEGPFYDSWPPMGHRQLFGNLPWVEIDPEVLKAAAKAAKGKGKAARPQGKPVKVKVPNKQKGSGSGSGVWIVESTQPLVDADRLFADFLPRAFRRPVDETVRKQYVAKVDERMKAGDRFDLAMRWAYRSALCSPDFLYHVEPAGALDDHALACRLSYLFWNSMPDDALTQLATSGRLHDPKVLREQVERLLKDAKSQRFIEDFLGQWLKLRLIAANDPDKKLYPEFSSYLQDSMVAETHAYFRELIEKDLDASHLVRSDFAMLNEKLAQHYGIPGVSGSAIRRVALPPDSPRGGFLTQASILKITANGTTTSPVVRGAFVMTNILGQPPDPPPASTPAFEPDVQGTKTIREQLAKHRTDAACAACHVKIDPPGFAMEAFDVLGGQRTRYRATAESEGDPAPRGSIDPVIRINFKLGPPVDASGQMPDERKFSGINEFETLLAANTPQLLRNLAEQFAVYATGREIAFNDRDEIAGIIARTNEHGGGIRTLLHELVQSHLFQTK